MDIAVRYVPTEHGVHKGKTVAVGNKPSLCFVNATEARCVVNSETQVEVVVLPRDEVLRSKLVPGYDDPEGPHKFVSYAKTVLQKEKMITADAYLLLDFALKPADEFPEKKKEPVRKKKRTKTAAPKSDKPSVIRELADDYNVEPTEIRKILRKAGERAPYEDKKKLNKILKKELI